MTGAIWNLSGYTSIVDPQELRDLFLPQLEKAGFRILHSLQHHFSPHGYTSLDLLAESHFAIHTFPEAGITYFELSSCLQQKFDNFIELLQKNPDLYQVTSIKTIEPSRKNEQISSNF